MFLKQPNITILFSFFLFPDLLWALRDRGGEIYNAAYNAQVKTIYKIERKKKE